MHHDPMTHYASIITLITHRTGGQEESSLKKTVYYVRVSLWFQAPVFSTRSLRCYSREYLHRQQENKRESKKKKKREGKGKGKGEGGAREEEKRGRERGREKGKGGGEEGERERENEREIYREVEREMGRERERQRAFHRVSRSKQMPPLRNSEIERSTTDDTYRSSCNTNTLVVVSKPHIQQRYRRSQHGEVKPFVTDC